MVAGVNLMTTDPQALRERYQNYQNNNSFGQNVRVGTTTPVEPVGGIDSNNGYFETVDYNVNYNVPEIGGGTHITGLGYANNTGSLKPYFA